jgi:hypothetical protein
VAEGIIASHAHALVVFTFALVAESVNGPVDALVPHIVWHILMIVLHALRAVITTHARVESRGGAADNNWSSAITIIATTIIDLFDNGIIDGPLDVADHGLGIHG